MNVLIYQTIILIQKTLAFKFMPENDSTIYAVSSNIMQKHIAKVEDIPYHAAIAYGTFYCSGVLIHSKVVLTTASCFEKRSEQSVYVKVGASTITGPGQVVGVEEVKTHEYYKHATAAHNDIALLLLKTDAEFGSDVKRIPLVEPETALRTGITIEVSGWGYRNLAPKLTGNLLWSEMVVMDNNDCKEIYKGLVTSSSFCAKYLAERRLSDNGGPAVYRKFLVGLLSFGGTANDEPHVAVFTNVSYFARWIALNTHRFTEKFCKLGEAEYSYEDYTIEDT